MPISTRSVGEGGIKVPHKASDLDEGTLAGKPKMMGRVKPVKRVNPMSSEIINPSPVPLNYEERRVSGLGMRGTKGFFDGEDEISVGGGDNLDKSVVARNRSLVAERHLKNKRLESVNRSGGDRLNKLLLETLGL